MYRKTFLVLFLVAMPSFIFAQDGLSGINQWLEGQIQAQSDTPVSYLLLLLGGFLASLLPCTYPLYPITVNIIKSRSGRSPKFIHPLAYYAGIVVIYFIFGIIASATGGAFNQVLRLPVTNLLIGVIIFLMGLSAAELLMIPMFSGAHGNATSKGFFGTFSMGMGAGLLASACVGPIVVTILLSIATASETVSFQLAISSALKMLLFGMGLGIPFFLLGVLGTSLPKAGKWMKWIQYGFAVIIIYFSWYFIEKALLGFGFSHEKSLTVFLTSLLFIFSFFLFQKGDLFPHDRMKKSLLLFSIVLSGIVLFAQFMPASVSTATTSRNDMAQNQSIEQKGSLIWYLNKEQAYAEALKTGKNVFVDFHANWCTNCKAFQELTQSNQELNEALQKAVLLKVYDTSSLFHDYRADKRFPELKIGLPFFIITDAKENLIFKTNDYTQTENMILFLTP
jgi:thiol:disulfide interchange protein DsbD